MSERSPELQQPMPMWPGIAAATATGACVALASYWLDTVLLVAFGCVLGTALALLAWKLTDKTTEWLEGVEREVANLEKSQHLPAYEPSREGDANDDNVTELKPRSA